MKIIALSTFLIYIYSRINVSLKNVILQVQKHSNLIEPLNKRIKEIMAKKIKSDTAKYVRFIELGYHCL